MSFFVFFLILPAIAAKHCIKLNILAILLHTICDLTIFLIPPYNMPISSKSAKKKRQ